MEIHAIESTTHASKLRDVFVVMESSFTVVRASLVCVVWRRGGMIRLARTHKTTRETQQGGKNTKAQTRSETGDRKGENQQTVPRTRRHLADTNPPRCYTREQARSQQERPAFSVGGCFYPETVEVSTRKSCVRTRCTQSSFVDNRKPAAAAGTTDLNAQRWRTDVDGSPVLLSTRWRCCNPPPLAVVGVGRAANK